MADANPDGQPSVYSDFDNRYLNAGVRRKALDRLPIVDISPFMSDGGDAARQANVAREIRDACVNIGFFYLTGHGIAEAELDELNDLGLRFFALPLEQKMTAHAGKNRQGQGFMQVGGVNPEANRDKTADLKERFIMTREVEPGEPVEGRYSAGASQWPRLTYCRASSSSSSRTCCGACTLPAGRCTRSP